MQGREDQVTGLRRFQGDFDRFFVAHLADQDDLGSLAERGAQGERKGRRITMQFALMDGGLLVVVHEFHRVFYSEDVVGLFFVDFVQDCRERRGLAGARRTGHQHDAVAEVCDLA